ncbi:hypothetical protein CHM34_03185 [Paludifilum halophilum]|uniref:Uncharacterized protein n=1 Tax=Paludifilum halophilum TaxID=1642702 RepID=A0A235B931_9BACL|nr:hypothetical protein CHM34_03185 [Paludifilum halophilum]
MRRESEFAPTILSTWFLVPLQETLIGLIPCRGWSGWQAVSDLLQKTHSETGKRSDLGETCALLSAKDLRRPTTLPTWIPDGALDRLLKGELVNRRK